MASARVIDAEGRELSPCAEDRARRLAAAGEAELQSEAPLVIRLLRCVSLPAPQAQAASVLAGERVLLHICCAPCSTYTVRHLRALGGQVTGYWYNPNVHPFSEHERRREALVGYATEGAFPVIWDPGYDLRAYMRAVAGHEARAERCALCYRLRLQRAAHIAAQEGMPFFTTTLLISPYQDQVLIKAAGDEAAAANGVRFAFENLRRGFAEHHHLAREHGLYQQRYCGCLFSEWESLDPQAATRGSRL
jgi:hypothetical protein